MLVAAIVGVDLRSTMDLDATLRGIRLAEPIIHDVIIDICGVPIDDNVTLRLESISPIRKDDLYGGFRVKILAVYTSIVTPFTVDISTGDVITPNPVKFLFRGIFDEEKQFDLWAYNIETVMAEKLETILTRRILNTRPRDFYDIYVLSTTQPFDRTLLGEAIEATAAHRGSSDQIQDVAKILQLMGNSQELKRMWEKYRRDFTYASSITYEMIMNALNGILLM